MRPIEALRESIALLTSREKRYLIVVIIIQIFIGLVDLAALAMIATFGSLGATYVSGFALPAQVQTLIDRIGLGSYSVKELLVISALTTAFLFVFRSVSSLILTRRIYLYLANRQTRISVDLAKRLSGTSFTWIKRRDTNELIYALTDGVGALMLGIISSFMIIVGEVFFLILILIGLIAVDPVTALFTLIFFSLFAIATYKSISAYSARLGRDDAKYSIHGRNQISSMILAYKEIYAFQRQRFFLDGFVSTREKATQARAKYTWLGQIPKANAEIGLVIGGGGLIGLQAWQSDAATGLSTLLVFLAAASRLTPSILRIQASFLTFRNSAGVAEITLKVIKALDEMDVPALESVLDRKRASYAPVEVKVSSLNFKYPDGEGNVLSDVSLTIKPGSFVALAGSSGSGKTTLADIIIGIYSGDSGSVTFNDVPNREWVRSNPGGIGYVPQSPYILGGDFITNIALGVPEDEIDIKRVEEVIAQAQLADLVRALPDGLQTDLSNFGSRLSGGEKQRLALARALYNKPSLLVIDEGTSALDGRTEFEVTRAILGLRSSLTIVVIAHRLASIKEADQIFLMDKGRILASGSFEELRSSSKEFQEQVSYMNLE
ncbi:MAG: ABC transporter ATP-binding protein [Candidatus Nanopelagicaceae bacterium]